MVREHAEQTIQAANEELAKIQAHYENEAARLKRDRLELAQRVQELG